MNDENQTGDRTMLGSAFPTVHTETNIRVGVVLLHQLTDLVRELGLTGNQILRFNAERGDAALKASSQRLNPILSKLQRAVMKTRMQPMVPDIALAVGKPIRLDMEGEETCDHGVEAPEIRTRAGKEPEGTLSLRACHKGGHIVIEISDDGAGIDIGRVKRIEKGFPQAGEAEKLSEGESLNLIFHVGLSTAVKSHIEKMGGVIDILNRPGAGCSFRIKIAVTGLPSWRAADGPVIAECDLAETDSLDGPFLEMERPPTVDDWVRDVRGELANYDSRGW